MTITTKAERNLKLVNLLTFGFGFRTFEGIIAVYFATITGSYTVGMSLFAIMNISASIFELPTGMYSDRVGRKKSLIIYFFMLIVATFLLGVANSTLALLLASLAAGFAIAMQSGTFSAYVYENLEVLNRQDDFRKVEGKRQALRRYSMVIGGLIGTAIIFFFSIKAAIFFTLIIFILTFTFSFFLTDISVSEKQSGNIYKDISKAWLYFKQNHSLRNISIGRIISGGIGNVEYRFRSFLFALVMPEWLVNFLGLLNNFLSGIFMHLTHKIVNRIGVIRSLVHTDIVDRSLTALLVLVNSITSGFLMTIISSAGFGMREVAAEDLLQKEYSKEQRATMGSLVGFFKNIAYGIAAIGFGFIADATSVIIALLIMQPILLIATFFFYRGCKQKLYT